MTYYPENDVGDFFDVSPKEEAGADFVARVGRELQEALIRRKSTQKLTQQQLAEKLDVDRSRVNRCFSGYNNLTLMAVGELIWALGGKPNFRIDLDDEGQLGRNNVVADNASARMANIVPHVSRTSATNAAIEKGSVRQSTSASGGIGMIQIVRPGLSR